MEHEFTIKFETDERFTEYFEGTFADACAYARKTLRWFEEGGRAHLYVGDELVDSLFVSAWCCNW